MLGTQTKDSTIAESEVMIAIKSLRTALENERSQARPKGKAGNVEVHFTETGVADYEQGEVTTVGKIVLIGDNNVSAHDMAEVYDQIGWICTSSGENEVTCACPDE